jgi:hypothetical protein
VKHEATPRPRQRQRSIRVNPLLTTSAELERQGLGGLAVEVERFRQSLKVPMTRQERALTVASRSRAERPQMQMEFER